MTDQTAPAWFPPAAAPTPQGIPLEPPAAAYAPVGSMAAMPAPVAPPVMAPPSVPSMPMPNEGPVPIDAIPQQLLPAAGSLAIGGAPLAMPAPVPAPAPAPAHAPAPPRDDSVSFDPPPAPAVAAAAPADAPALPSTAPDTHAVGVDATGQWWAPGTALVAAMFALAWQLVATYARERLPARLASGQPIDRFDSIVDRLPLAGGMGGQALGLLLVAGAGTLVYIGYLRGVREPGLQFAIGIVTGLALLLPFLLAAI